MKTIQGDLIKMFMDDEFDIIIHGCNCKRMMGAGIALQIAEEIPEAVMADDMYNPYLNDIDKLSNYSLATIRRESGKIGIVINLYTQYNPGKDLNINALFLGFKKLTHKLLKAQNLKIGIPKIGCGLAGGDWDIIGPEIFKIMEGYDITYVEYVP